MPAKKMAEAAEVTLTCPDCDFSVTGMNMGPGSAPFKLGIHKSRQHGYGKRPGRSPAQRAARAADESTSVVSVIRDAASEVSDKTDKPPTVDELGKALGRLFYTGSVAEASYLVETDPTIPPGDEASRDALHKYLSLTPNDARDLAYPFARVFGRSKLNARFGRTLVDNIDVASSVAVVVELGVHHRRYLRERRRRIAALEGGAPLVLPPSAGPGPSAGIVAGSQPSEVFVPPTQPAEWAPPGGTVNPGEMTGSVAQPKAGMLWPDQNGSPVVGAPNA